MGSKGFTLVELMIAMIILLFVSLAMMQTALVTMSATTKNSLRDEGVKLASETLNRLRHESIVNMDDKFDGTTGTVEKQIRNFNAEYTVINSITEIEKDAIYSMSVYVQWTWKKTMFNTTLRTIRGSR